MEAEELPEAARRELFDATEALFDETRKDLARHTRELLPEVLRGVIAAPESQVARYVRTLRETAQELASNPKMPAQFVEALTKIAAKLPQASEGEEE